MKRPGYSFLKLKYKTKEHIQFMKLSSGMCKSKAFILQKFKKIYY